MSDFYERRDLALVEAFTDPASKFDLSFEAQEQLVHNDSAPTSGIVVELSFDGEHVHARLQSNGPSKVINWVGHIRKALWLRRAPGTPAGPTLVEVMATTR